MFKVRHGGVDLYIFLFIYFFIMLCIQLFGRGVCQWRSQNLTAGGGGPEYFFRFVNLHAAKLGQFGEFWCIFGSDFALIIFLILQILIKSKMYARVLVVFSFFEERPIIVRDVGPFVYLSVRRSK